MVASLATVVGLKPSSNGRIEGCCTALLGGLLDGAACFLHVNVPSLSQRLGVNVVLFLGIEGPACCI